MFPISQVQVGPIAYTIEFDDRAADAANCWGRIDYARQSILLDSKASPDHLAVTVLHEILHAVLHSVGIEKDPAEDVISRSTPTLLDTLRRNPKLVHYLLTTDHVAPDPQTETNARPGAT